MYAVHPQSARMSICSSGKPHHNIQGTTKLLPRCRSARTPPPLQGRGGAIRIKSSCYDLLVFSLYFAPNPSVKSHRLANAALIYVIFNPYNQLDTVFMENEAELKEYVENEAGMIYRGSASQRHPKNCCTTYLARLLVEAKALKPGTPPLMCELPQMLPTSEKPKTVIA